MDGDALAGPRGRAPLFVPDRLRRIGRIWALAAMVAVGFHLWGETRLGLVDPAGHPFGDDTLNFWAGARVALGGHAAIAYDMPAFHAYEQAAIGGAIQPYHYSYPPVMMLLTAPLALLPFLPFWAGWLGGGWLLFAACVRYWLPGGWALYAVAAPAVMIDVISGQAGCWMAAIFGFGLILLPAQPVAAGLVLSLALFKPQLIWLLPIALVGGGHWRALAGFVAGAALLLAGSVRAFGFGLWTSYAQQAVVLRGAILENGAGVWHRFVSVFVLMRHLGAGVAVAYGVQGIVSLAMAALVMWVWRTTRAPGEAWAPARRNAVLVLASIFASPYVSDYDLVVATFVPLWLLPGRDDTGLWAASSLVILAPLVAAPLALGTGVAGAGLLLLPALYYAFRLSPSLPGRVASREHYPVPDGES